MSRSLLPALAAPGPAAAEPAPRRPRRWAAALPWLLLAAGTVAALLGTGTPLVDVVRYAGYWLLCLVLPGTLVFRALRGSRGNLPEDVGWGAATGLLVEIVAWALAAATGAQGWLWLWPVPVVVLFLAVPGLRRHWRVAAPRPLPLRWSWATAGAGAVAIGWAAAQWLRYPLPPVTFQYYQDLLYHLSLVQELTHDLPFQVPQLAGETLKYHYLSDAHMAAASMITGVDPATVLLRLWLGPVVIVVTLCVAALARQVTGRWWAGPLTALVAVVGAPLMLGGAVATGGSPISELSPSLTYLIPFLCLVVALCVDLVRGRRLGLAWFLMPLLAVACAGAKASGLPIVIAGLAVALVAQLLLTRRLQLRTAAGLGVLVVGMAVGGAVFVGGGAGGMTVQVLSQLPWLTPYRDTIGRGLPMPGLLPPTMHGIGLTGWLLALGIAAWWVVLQAARFVGLGTLLDPRTRRDGAAWLLSGMVAAGAGAMWLLYHPSASQDYFYLPALPFAALLTVWLLAEHLPTRRAGILLAVAGAVGMLACAGLRWYAADPVSSHSYRTWGLALLVPVLRAALLAAIGVVGWLIARRYLPALRGRGLAAGLAVLLGASLATGLITTARPVPTLLRDGPAHATQAVSAAEMRAARWLDATAPPEDVVATNVHCVGGRTVPHCDARAFWVSGLGGHRTVIESWGYTDQAVADNGLDGRTYFRAPPPDPARYALNERVFTAPTAADLAALHRRYHARWLLADTNAGPVSRRLDRLAVLRHTDGPVRIYRLR